MNPTQLESNKDKMEPSEELNSKGDGNGLEVERSEIFIAKPFDPAKIDIITVQRTIDLLLTRLKNGELDLSPDFQRRSDLWSEAAKSSLIESICLKIPIPSLYVAEDQSGNYVVVDGLQRLCAIAHFVEVSALNKAVKKQLPPLRLVKLSSLKEFEDRAFVELPRSLQRRINETELTLHIIRAGTPSEVKFNIFSRINQGGLPLTAQEIRNAIYRETKWSEHISSMAESTAFRVATEGKIKGERMEDRELVLRFVAHYALGPEAPRPREQNLDDFLNDFVDKKCAPWSEEQWQKVRVAFQRSLEFCILIFGDHAFRRYRGESSRRAPINRGLFETETVTLAHMPDAELNLLAQRRPRVLDLLARAHREDQGFISSLIYATGRGSSSNDRRSTIERILTEALDD